MTYQTRSMFAIVLFAAHTAAHAVQQLDLEMYKVEAKGGSGNAVFDAGDSVGIQCSWSVRKLVAGVNWPTENWTGVISVDGKTIHQLPIQIKPDDFVNKVSKAFGWTWKATGAGPHTVGCALVNSKYNQDNNMGNNKASTTIQVNGVPLNLKGTPQTMAQATPVLPPQSTQLPDIASAAQLTVAGKFATAWGGAVTLTDADARASKNGVCEITLEHEMRNIGSVASGTFNRRWTNQSQAATLSATAPAIAAGGALKRIDTLALKPGVSKLSLGLDDLNQVKEINENNNAYVLTVTVTGSCGGGVRVVDAPQGAVGGSRWGRDQDTPLPGQQPGPPTSPLKQQR